MAQHGILTTGEKFVTVWDGCNARWYATTVGPVAQMRDRIFARVRTKVFDKRPYRVCSCGKWRVLDRGSRISEPLWTRHLAKVHTATPLEHGRHWREWAQFDEARDGRVWQPL